MKDFSNSVTVAAGYQSLTSLLTANGYDGVSQFSNVTVINPVGSALTVKVRFADSTPSGTTGTAIPAGSGLDFEKKRGSLEGSTFYIYSSGAGSIELVAMSNN